MQREIISLFWRVSNRYKYQRALSIFFPIVAVITNNIAAPYVLSQFLNRLQSGNVTIDNTVGLIALYAGLLVIGEVILWRLALYFCWTFEVASSRDLYNKIFRKLSTESTQFHANRFGGSLVSQSSKLQGAFERFWDMIIWSVTPMLTMTISAIVVIAWLSYWMYAAFLAVFAIVFIATVIITSRFLAKRNTEEAQASTKSNGYLADTVTNIVTVKSFGREPYEAHQAHQYISNWHEKSTSLKWGVLGATGIYSVFLVIIRLAALVAAILAVQHNVASIGMVYLLLAYSLDVGRQLWEMNHIVRMYNRVVGDAYDMTVILNTPPTIVDKTSAKRLLAAHGSVMFDRVSFTHDNGKGEAVFQDFTLTIAQGQRVGIVGHSGSGKTTLTKILLRFADVQAGRITIDGQDIAAVTQQSLHHAIAYVPQEPLLFHRSLRDNIAYGKPDASEQDIIRAAELANTYSFIKRLPDGFDTLVGERGVKLSGGQRQRIAIARAILKDAPIIVLDEATSALDSESEKLIQKSLDTLMKGRTSIVIAHRLSTISKLDRIIVLDNGKVVEDGTHSDLLAQNGIYAKLWSHQSGGFIEE